MESDPLRVFSIFLSLFIWIEYLIWAGYILFREYQHMQREARTQHAFNTELKRLQLNSLIEHAQQQAQAYRRHSASQMTVKQAQEVAEGLAADHVHSYGYTHVPVSEALYWYAEAFRCTYFSDAMPGEKLLDLV